MPEIEGDAIKARVIKNRNGQDGTPGLLGCVPGSVPGRQTSPRAEAVALLHALRTTAGNAVFVCDNLGVVKRYKNMYNN